ncbi:hypothetical protein [Bacillus sp. ISL-46]|uniref:hypothetical protein n=1 Tax=Bacillus sp. ISL-46 TaxID=2819129 RepID=UPI002034E49B|nr:hypothetical protein [Bacillus sp. ISL-46]
MKKFQEDAEEVGIDQPDEDIPVIYLSVKLEASLEETYKWGQESAKVFLYVSTT